MHEYFHADGKTDLSAMRNEAEVRRAGKHGMLGKEESVIHHHPYGAPCDGGTHDEYKLERRTMTKPKPDGHVEVHTSDGLLVTYHFDQLKGWGVRNGCLYFQLDGGLVTNYPLTSVQVYKMHPNSWTYVKAVEGEPPHDAFYCNRCHCEIPERKEEDGEVHTD